MRKIVRVCLGVVALVLSGVLFVETNSVNLKMVSALAGALGFIAVGEVIANAIGITIKMTIKKV